MIKLPKQATFVPAMSGALRNKVWNGDNNNATILGHDPKFWTPNSYFNYNYILTSTYYELDFKVDDYHEFYNYPRDYILIADSGGFQQATFRKANLPITVSPIQTLRWMENNADIGMNLDVPPWTNFNASLKESLDNFTLFERQRTNYDMSLYNVLHGKTLNEMKIWYDAVKDYNFEGWALGVRPSNNICMQIIGYLLLYDKSANNILTNFHMFGVSGIKNMIVLAYLSNYFNGAITFDSSSYDTGTRFRKYSLPKDIRFSLDFGRSAHKTLKTLPCKCPVCSKLDIRYLYDQESPSAYLNLPLHNLYQYLDVNRTINAIVSDEYAFDEYVKSVNEYDTLKITRAMLDCYESKGLEKTYEIFKHLMTLRDENQIYQECPYTAFKEIT